MGGVSSKASRKLPSKPSASWAGARTDRTSPSQPLRKAVASETKNASIEMDGGDPHFMQKLNQLGPVKVDHHMSAIRPDAHMERVLQSREESEKQAASHSPTRNRVLASELFNALEQRKSARSQKELSDLASRYNVDVDVLERVARFTTAPSIIEDSRQKVVDEEGTERFTVLAAWEDPPSGASTSNS